MRSCMNSKSRVVDFVATHGVHFSPVSSFIGQNALICSRRFQTSVNIILQRCVNNVVKSHNNISNYLYYIANVVAELIALRDNRIQLFDAHFFLREELDDFVVSLCTIKYMFAIIYSMHCTWSMTFIIKLVNKN